MSLCKKCGAEIPETPPNDSGICESCWIDALAEFGWFGPDGKLRTTRPTEPVTGKNAVIRAEIAKRILGKP